jgi:mannosylglycerate hydrolase
VAVVPHSHWDREWYAPFETYRVRLVSMLDQVLELLETDSAYDHFHLDGQVAALDDYLEWRPENEERAAALVAAGRLAIGPWYVLMDEFCVSGETIVRNLQLGLSRARHLGAEAFTGYLPDMFGHVAQMPQLLRRAGIAHAVVWRGVPGAVTSRAFAWVSPDGSRVRAEYLPVGYASGAFLPKEPDDLVRRLAAHEREIAGFIGPEGPMLLMNGGDHQDPQAWMPDLVAKANSAQDHFELHTTALAPFLAAQPAPEQCWTGELRSGARAPLLMGVLSNRVDVKQAAASAEAALERLAEPMAALWLPPGLWPSALLDRAWLQLIVNSAHDSICACSVDAVGRAVASRYDTAEALAAEVVRSARAITGVATAKSGIVVANSLPEERRGLIELVLGGTEAPAGAQVIEGRPAGTVSRSGVGADLGRILGELAADGELGPAGRAEGADVSGAGDPLVITLLSDPTGPADPAMAPVVAEAWARAGAGRSEPLTVRVVTSGWQRVLVQTEPIPGWGWARWEPSLPSPGAVTVAEASGALTMDNGLLSVAVHRATGLVDAAAGSGIKPAGDGMAELRVAGLNRIVEEGDGGDTYNFSAVGRPAVDQPTSVEVELVESGPVRAVARVTRVYPWNPPTAVTTDVELRAGEAAARFTTSFDHASRDHRVRAIFPLVHPADESLAECAFAAVTRREAEGGPQEPALATFPSRRWVSAGGITVHHQGLLEYELVDGRALALTLLRATGILSRPAPPARPNVAGPAMPLADPQLPGPRSFRYAVELGASDPWSSADHLWTDLQAVPAAGDGPLPDRGRRLEIELDGARVSALHRDAEGRLVIRLFNPRREPATVRLPGRTGAVVDLGGGPLSDWAEQVVLAPDEIGTLRLDTISLD